MASEVISHQTESVLNDAVSIVLFRTVEEFRDEALGTHAVLAALQCAGRVQLWLAAK